MRSSILCTPRHNYCADMLLCCGYFCQFAIQTHVLHHHSACLLFTTYTSHRYVQHTFFVYFLFCAPQEEFFLKRSFYSLMFLLIQLYNQVVLKFMKSISSSIFFFLVRSCVFGQDTDEEPATNISSPDSVESRILRCIHNIFSFCTRSPSSSPSLLYYHCVVNGPAVRHTNTIFQCWNSIRFIAFLIIENTQKINEKEKKKKPRAVAVVRDYTVFPRGPFPSSWINSIVARLSSPWPASETREMKTRRPEKLIRFLVETKHVYIISVAIPSAENRKWNICNHINSFASWDDWKHARHMQTLRIAAKDSRKSLDRAQRTYPIVHTVPISDQHKNHTLTVFCVPMKAWIAAVIIWHRQLNICASSTDTS